MKSEPKILFLDILTDDPKIRKDFHQKIYAGQTYSELTRKAMGLKKSFWTFADGAKCAFPENIREFDGVVIGGSVENPVKGRIKPWMSKNFAFIRKLVKNDTPILGICGGLQFTARALGSEIIFNPKGKEFGSGELKISPAGKKDPIFSGLPTQFTIHLSHKCIAAGLKKEWKVLGSTGLCAPQAIAIGKKIRLLQFHPEMRAASIKAIAKVRKEKHTMPVKNAWRYGKKIMGNFIKYFVLPYHKQKFRI